MPASTNPTTAAHRPVAGRHLGQGGLVVGDERRLEQQVLGRVAGDGQLGEHGDVAAGGVGPLQGGEDAGHVAVEVADDVVDLAGGHPESCHGTDPNDGGRHRTSGASDVVKSVVRAEITTSGAPTGTSSPPVGLKAGVAAVENPGMAKRRNGGAAVVDDLEDDWTTRWRCAKCGYGNIGRERCIECGAKAPAEARALGGLHADHDFVGPTPAAGAGRRAGRTVLGMIGLNLAFQVVLAGFVVANSMDLASAVRLSLVTGLLFYGALALWVVGRSASLGLRPTTGRQGALIGAAEGFVVGGGLALLMAGLLRLALGHPVIDPTSAVLAADGGVGPLLLGFLAIAVAAPVVEELVFRGFLAEALRGRGRGGPC